MVGPLVVGGLVAWCAAGRPAAAAEGSPATESARGDATVGAALAKRWCGQCHLISGANVATDAAPTFDAIARNPASTPAHLRMLMSKQHVSMPPIPLSGSEADDLIAYILKERR
ncbi:MAG TPA: hypothetical protein VMU33_15540 [Burkholderiaceae bacterium]|nr:hypothetical protein [Burkholderiaceae bacterium]